MDQAFFTIRLAEETFAATHLGAVLGVVGRLLVGQHIAQRRVAGEGEPTDLLVDVADGTELARKVHVGLDVDGRQSVGEAAGLAGAVVLLHMPPGAGNGEMIQQGEVVKTQHFHQLGGCLFSVVQCQPAVELRLRLAGRGLDAGDAVLHQGSVIPLCDKGDLVAQVGQAIVDRRGRKHEHAGLDAFADDASHQAVVARFLALVRGLVAEVV